MAAGVLVVAVLGVLRVSPYRPLPADPLTPSHWAADAIVGVVGMIFVIAAFLYALRESWAGRLSLSLVLRLGIAFQVLVIALPVLLSRDVYSYAIYGRMLSVYHVNPYVAAPIEFPRDPLLPMVGPLWRDSSTVYGPIFTLLSGALAGLARTPDALTFAFKALSGIASIATMILTARLAMRIRPDRAAFAAVLVGWNPVVLFQVIGGGHNDSLVALAVVGSLLVLDRARTSPTEAIRTRRELVAIAILTVAALVKAVAGLPLLLTVVVAVARRPAGRRLPMLVRAMTIVLGLSLVCAWPFLQAENPTLGLANLATHAEWPALPVFFRSVLGHVADVVVGKSANELLRYVVQGVFLAVFLLALSWVASQTAKRARSITTAGLGAAWGWAFLLFLLTIPQLLPWYLMWLLPLAWLLPKVPRIAVIVLGVLLGMATALGMPAPSAAFVSVLINIGHLVVAPALLAVLVWVFVHLRRVVTGRVPIEVDSGGSLERMPPDEFARSA